MQPLLEQIGQQHPEVLEQIQANQDEFVRLINEPIDQATLAQTQMAMQAMGGMGGLPGMGGGGMMGMVEAAGRYRFILLLRRERP